MTPLTEKVRKQLIETWGFRLWDEEDGMLLVPKKVFDRVPDGTQLRAIDDEIVVKGRDEIDMDTRWGMLAVGIEPAQFEEVLKALEGRQ